MSRAPQLLIHRPHRFTSAPTWHELSTTCSWIVCCCASFKPNRPTAAARSSSASRPLSIPASDWPSRPGFGRCQNHSGHGTAFLRTAQQSVKPIHRARLNKPQTSRGQIYLHVPPSLFCMAFSMILLLLVLVLGDHYRAPTRYKGNSAYHAGDAEGIRHIADEPDGQAIRQQGILVLWVVILVCAGSLQQPRVCVSA